MPFGIGGKLNPEVAQKTLERIRQFRTIEQSILTVGPDIKNKALIIRNSYDGVVRCLRNIQATVKEMRKIAPWLQGKKTNRNDAAAMRDLRRWGELYADVRKNIEQAIEKMNSILENSDNINTSLENITRLMSQTYDNLNQSERFVNKEKGRIDREVKNFQDGMLHFQNQRGAAWNLRRNMSAIFGNVGVGRSDVKEFQWALRNAKAGDKWGADYNLVYFAGTRKEMYDKQDNFIKNQRDPTLKRAYLANKISTIESFMISANSCIKQLQLFEGCFARAVSSAEQVRKKLEQEEAKIAA